MKTKLNIKQVTSILSVTGLILLLVLSPCKVRNYIEYQLNIPQSETLNKSQTTLNNSNCVGIENIGEAIISSKTISQNKVVLAVQNFNESLTSITFSNKKFQFQKARNLSVSFAPLYILYRNFKVYL